MDLPSLLLASARCSYPDTLNAFPFFSAAARSPVVGLKCEQMEVSRGVEAIRGFLAPSSVGLFSLWVCGCSFSFLSFIRVLSGYQLSFQAVFCCWLQELAKRGDLVASCLGSNFLHRGVDSASHDDDGASYL